MLENLSPKWWCEWKMLIKLHTLSAQESLWIMFLLPATHLKLMFEILLPSFLPSTSFYHPPPPSLFSVNYANIIISAVTLTLWGGGRRIRRKKWRKIFIGKKHITKWLSEWEWEEKRMKGRKNCEAVWKFNLKFPFMLWVNDKNEWSEEKCYKFCLGVALFMLKINLWKWNYENIFR